MQKFTLKKLPISNFSKEFSDNIATKADSLKKASQVISKYDGMIEFFDNPSLLSNLLFLQEAVESSNIEGTIATIQDILELDVGNELDARIKEDVEEIENYEKALKYAIAELENNNYIFSNKILKEIQAILVNNSRGKDKLRGTFKQKQNFIGNRFDNKITYTPVSPLLTEEYMQNLTDFINFNHQDDVDGLIKTAIIHAQFELIHPFEDGNGRVGRIMIPLLLKKYRVLDSNFFYISYFLSKNRNSYINTLENISKNQDLKSWIEFFIYAIEQQSQILIAILKEINEIFKDTKQKIHEIKTTFAVVIIDFLFEKIKFDTSYFIKKTNINQNTARKLLKDLVATGIISIEKEGLGSKSHIYKFDSLYNLIQELSKKA